MILRCTIRQILLLIAIFFVSMTTVFAVPTESDLNIKNDAKSGVTREGYIEGFK